jgi:hypothetical protein
MIKIKRGKLLSSKDNLENLSKTKNKKFAIKLYKILQKIEQEREMITKITENDVEFKTLVQNFNNERVEILKNFSKKNEKGEPVIENNSFTFENDEIKAKAIAEVSELLKKEEYKNLESEEEKQRKEIEEILDEEIEINIDIITEEELPDGISMEEIKLISDFINF